MSLIIQFRRFRSDAPFYEPLSLAEFRDKILPLRHSTAWSATEQAYAARLVTLGGGFALQRLCGRRHACATALGAFQPEPTTRVMFDGMMTQWLTSCKNAGWRPDDYASYVAYLDSGLSLAEWVNKIKAAEGLPIAPVAPTVGAPVSEDTFAIQYRAASPGYQRAVREYIERGRQDTIRERQDVKFSA